MACSSVLGMEGTGLAAAASRTLQKGSQQGRWPDGPPNNKHAPAPVQDVPRRILGSEELSEAESQGLTVANERTAIRS